MATCYRCGRPLSPGKRFRRPVKTGEWSTKRFTRQRASSVTTRFSMRVVCSDCAKFLDKPWTRHEMIQLVEFGLAALFILFMIVSGLLK